MIPYLTLNLCQIMKVISTYTILCVSSDEKILFDFFLKCNKI